MTQSDERKERNTSRGGGGMSWLWIVLGIVIILLLVWWFWPDGTDVDPDLTEPDAGEMGYEPTLDDETRIGDNGPLGDDEDATSSDRTVAVPASPGIATRDVENVDASDGDGMTETAADAAQPVPLRDILDDPDGWSGRQVNGTVESGGMATDVAFWITDGDDRLLALVVDRSRNQGLSIESGRRLQVSDAMVHSSQDFDQNLTGPLDDETRQLLQDQPVLLVISERNLNTQ